MTVLELLPEINGNCACGIIGSFLKSLLSKYKRRQIVAPDIHSSVYTDSFAPVPARCTQTSSRGSKNNGWKEREKKKVVTTAKKRLHRIKSDLETYVLEIAALGAQQEVPRCLNHRLQRHHWFPALEWSP